MRIRPASVHDAEALRRVHAADREADWYVKLIDAPGTPRAGTWVAEAEGEVVGFGHFREAAAPAVADLRFLEIHPDWRGKGVARPLLEGLLDDMRVLEFRVVEVVVPAEEARASRFLERAGFRFIADEDAGVRYRLAL
jgi:N-acetylglutamate synthase-like GNAT family acetyltransferase